MADPRKDIVRRGYEATAEAWASARGPGSEAPWLQRFVAALEPGVSVLDLGCGNGDPIAAALAEAGFAVTGVDVSEALLRRAAQRVPGARLVHADMAEVEFPAQSFAGAIAWDSSFHLPPAEQRALVARVHAWLAPGAPFLLTAGGTEGELFTEHLGVPMYYGAMSPTAVREALAQAGFTAIELSVDEPGPLCHTTVLARA